MHMNQSARLALRLAGLSFLERLTSRDMLRNMSDLDEGKPS